jgi:hypothetical protein
VEKTFHHRVIPTVALAAHTGRNAVLRAYSARRLPLIPVETCHRFQSEIAPDSD